MSNPSAPPSNPKEFEDAISNRVNVLPEVLATIEGKDLPASLYVEMLLKSMPPQQLPAFISASDEDITNHARQFIQDEVNQVLMELCASKDGYEGSPDEVMQDFDRWHASLKEEERSNYESFLKGQSLSHDEYRSQSGENKARQRRIATDRWVQEKAISGLDVSQEEVESAYEQGKAENCTSPDQVKVAHIPFRHDNSDESRQTCREKAEQVLEKIRGGAGFEDMVKENPSSEGHLQRMGVLDFFTRGTYNEKFEAVAFTLKAGEVSDIVDTGEGYEIIKALEVKKGEVTPLSEVEDEIRKGLMGQKVNLRIGELIDQQRPHFSIEFHI